MVEDESEWPTFELVEFDPSHAPMGLLRESRLFKGGVPRDLFDTVYRAADSLTLIETMDQRELTCFGDLGSWQLICLDPASGEVVEVSKLPDIQPRLLNSSLDQFSETVRLVIERFPFYGSDSELEERESVAGELLEEIRNIDERALVQDGFWATFIDDLKIGDYSTEDVLS
ncbi:SUKH-4 family immunity protein [Streptosporangium sp. NBC_01495]|uniref:SUKH-4 family immunity protein n=1 Tax=Streptosporangium sp. NBC_01495 TaxID=2903899 RepID=UPI002E33393A|nr:SUKH-4 family immunity protein [Streptosporangium sp. NBC_01495]